MYRIEDKSAAVREVQRFLIVIAERDDTVPQLPADGFYSEELRLAVMEYQRRKGLPASGSVDKETFDLLYSEYSEILLEEERKKGVINYASFPLKLGDSGGDVRNLNTTLSELSLYYKNVNSPSGGFYSKVTEEAVKSMQFHLLVPESGEVTLEFYDRLGLELSERKKFAKYY